MKLLKNLNNNILQAGSLLETVIAISIVSTCVLIAAVVFSKVTEHETGILKLKASQKVNQLMIDTNNLDFFKDEIYTYKGYEISKKIINYRDKSTLKLIEFTIKINNKLTTQQFIVAYNEN